VSVRAKCGIRPRIARQIAATALRSSIAADRAPSHSLDRGDEPVVMMTSEKTQLARLARHATWLRREMVALGVIVYLTNVLALVESVELLRHFRTRLMAAAVMTAVAAVIALAERARAAGRLVRAQRDAGRVVGEIRRKRRTR